MNRYQITVYRMVEQKAEVTLDAPNLNLANVDLKQKLPSLEWATTELPATYDTPELRRKNRVKDLGSMDQIRRTKAQREIQEVYDTHPKLPLPKDP